MSLPRHALVVGAGIFGVTGALALRQRGWRVTLCDPGPLPHPRASSTDISKVIRMDYGADDWTMDWMVEAMAGWDAWNRRWQAASAPPLYHEQGFLILARAPMAPGGFERESFVRLPARGLAPQRLDATSLAARFPAWSTGLHQDGYYNPRAGWAESGAVVSALLRGAVDAGVELREGCKVTGLVERSGRVCGATQASGDPITADAVVVAAGPWTPGLVPELRAVMAPVAQPVLHFQVPDPRRWSAPHFVPWAADIGQTGWYGFPALADGTLKIANHGQGQRFDPEAPRELPAGAEARFRGFMRQALPEIAEAPLTGSRLCLYCDTFDSRFWIDRHPDRPGLVVATGGSGHGFKFAPVLGDLIADRVEGHDHPRADRVAWRTPTTPRFEDARHAG